MQWNTNIDEAPKGQIVKVTNKKGVDLNIFESVEILITTPDGKVRVSRWLPDNPAGDINKGRWEWVNPGKLPKAWAPLPKPYGVDDV